MGELTYFISLQIIWNILTMFFSKGNLVNEEKVPNILDCALATCEMYIKSDSTILFSTNSEIEFEVDYSNEDYSKSNDTFLKNIVPKTCSVSNVIPFINFNDDHNVFWLKNKFELMNNINNKILARTKDEKVVTLMNKLIPRIQMTSKWKILQPPFIHEFNILKQDNFFIIIINSAVNLTAIEINTDNILLSFINGNSVNLKASYLIILTDNADEDIIIMIMAVFYYFELFDVIIMQEDEHGIVRLFRGEKHSTACRAVKKIEVINTCVRDGSGVMFTSNSELRKEIGVNEFQGCHILLHYGHYPPLTIKSENHVSGQLNIKETGISLTLLDLVLQHMKISHGTLENNPLTNKLFSYARLNTEKSIIYANSILSYYPHTYNWFVRVAEIHPRWSSISRVFQITTWITVVITVLLAGFASWIFSIYANDESLVYNKLSSCFLNTWGIILNVGVKLPQTIKLRCVILSWIMFALAINTVYQTFVTSFMVDPGRLHQINSYDELINSKYNLILTVEQDIHRKYGEKVPQNLKLLNNVKNVLMFALVNPETAIFLNEEILMYNYNKLCEGNLGINFHKIYDSSYSSYFHLYFSNIWIVQRVSELLERLDESGISMKIANDIIDPIGLQRWAVSKVNLEEEYVTMSLLHLQSAFIFLFLLHGISVSVFLYEIIFFSYCRERLI
ncbi:Ionotropic receptor 755 [Blattella germanica]|nr:Ionotropic receptor 755 [Blattella germanica]